MSTKAYIAIQDLTYTENQLGLGVTITYTNTGTAGSEVVTVSGHAISVAIQSGVSTATQIKTALEKVDAVNRLVTITVTGTGSNAQKSCVDATLASGSAATYATKTLGMLTFTAVASGTAGNSVRVKFANGALNIGVSTNDITITFVDGVTTVAAVYAAYLASSPAMALATVSHAPGANVPMFVSAASDFIALAGGAAAVAPSVIVQDLTFASDDTGTSDNGSTISYTTGATAGAEVVSVDGADMSIQIQNGVSTATQIKTAFDASEDTNGVRATGEVEVVDYANGHFTASTGSILVNAYAPLHLTAATGSYTINAYAPLHLTKASGTITYGVPDTAVAAQEAVTVVDYTKASAVKASATIEVVDYSKLAQATATPSGVITYGTPNNASTVVVTGPAGGPYTFTKVASDPEAGEFTSISQLTYLLNQIAGIDATDDTTDITLTVETAGTGPNSWTVTGTDSYSGLSISFSGGQDHATLTVNGTVLTEGTDWTAATGNNETAASLETAVEAVTSIDSSATGAVITAEVSTAGTAGNAFTLATSDAVNLTISGANFASGRDATTVTVAGHALVANVDWTAETDNDTTADNLAAAIDALAEVTAANPAAAEITVIAATAGTAGNALTLVTSEATAVTVGAATLSGGVDASTVTVNGSTFTCVAAAPGANEFSAIAELTALVTAVTDIDATDNGTVITVEAATAGTAGNSRAMSKTGSGLTLSGATLTGGIDAATVTVAGHVLTESTDWTAATGNNETAESLKDAIHALSEVNCTRTDAVCNIVAATAGTAGNSIALLTSDDTNCTRSGATLSGGIDAATVTVAGHVLTESTEWTASSDTATTAESLKDAIHALAEVTCTRSSSTCNIVAATKGTAGDAITLAASDEVNLTLSGATLSGGIDALEITVGSDTLVESTDFDCATDNGTTATSLAAAIDALAGVSATAADAVVTVVSDTFGTGGNSTALTTSDASVATVSGATLAGGTNAWSCTVSGTGSTAQKTVNAIATAGAVADNIGSYYITQATTALTTSFVEFPFGFSSSVMTIVNDETSGSKAITVSLDGTNTAYVLMPTESLRVDNRSFAGIFLKYATGAPNYRLMVL